MVGVSELKLLLQEGLIATGHVAACALARRHDSKIRASTDRFPLNKNDIKHISSALKNPHKHSDGMSLAGKNYDCIRADKQALYLQHGQEAIIIVKTNSHFVIGTSKSNMHVAICIEAVEKFGDYIRAKGM